MGDLWAGAEVHLTTLLASLGKTPDLDISAILFNEGRLASELMGLGVKTQVIAESRHKPLSIVKQLTEYFRHYQVDILHTHKPKDNVLGAVSWVCARSYCRVMTIKGLVDLLVGSVSIL